MLPNTLKTLRKQAGLTQEMLAKKINVSPKSISAWEQGTRQPSLEATAQIANLFNVTTDKLLGVNNNEIPKWANENDVLELDKFLESNGAMTFEGVELTRAQKDRVQKILIEVFWEELKKDRDKGVR